MSEISDSILKTVKQMVGVSQAETAFDVDLIMHINAAFMVLNQLGLGSSSGFRIEDDTQKWSDFMTDLTLFGAVQSYMALKVKMLFDPPGSSYVLESVERQIAEFEARLIIQNETTQPPAPLV